MTEDVAVLCCHDEHVAHCDNEAIDVIESRFRSAELERWTNIATRYIMSKYVTINAAIPNSNFLAAGTLDLSSKSSFFEER